MSHIVDFQLAFGLVLFLEMSREVVEDSTTAPALHVAPWRPIDLTNPQACVLI